MRAFEKMIMMVETDSTLLAEDQETTLLCCDCMCSASFCFVCLRLCVRQGNGKDSRISAFKALIAILLSFSCMRSLVSPFCNPALVCWLVMGAGLHEAEKEYRRGKETTAEERNLCCAALL